MAAARGRLARLFFLQAIIRQLLALPTGAGRRGFIAVVDGEPIDGSNETQPFVHATDYDAMFAACPHCTGRVHGPSQDVPAAFSRWPSGRTRL